MLEAQAQSWLKSLPKVSLHCHLEGTMRPSTYRALAQKYHIDTDARALLADDAFYTFATFYEFLMVFRDICAVLREPEDYGLLAKEYALDALRDGVVASEIFVAPAAWLRMHPKLDMRATFEAIARALQENQRETGMHVAILCDITRNFGADQALQTVEIACAMRDLGVIGIGLGGDEVNFPAELFRTAFRRAQKADLHCVAHAGEVAGAESVHAAVEILGAERIGHGVHAIDDLQVLHMLSRRNIVVEQAPTSNRLTGCVIGPHPMKRFVDAGVRVALDADDPAIFGSSILDEYRHVAELHGAAFVLDRAYDAVVGSFMSNERKRKLYAALEAHAQNTLPEFVSQRANGSA